MRSGHYKIAVWLLVIGLAVGGGYWWSSRRQSAADDVKRGRAFLLKGEEGVGKRSESSVTSVETLPQRERAPVFANAGVGAEVNREFDIPKVREPELDEATRVVISRLWELAQDHDLEGLRNYIRRIYGSPKEVLGSNDIPLAVKKAMLKALGSFGVDGAVSMIDFLQDDPQPEVRAMTVAQLQQALLEFGISDVEKSAIVSAASTALTDEHDINTFLSRISSMRHSVAVQTVINVDQMGTEAARSQLPKVIEFYTGMDGVTTVDGFVEWLETHPDGKDDARKYGGWVR